MSEFCASCGLEIAGGGTACNQVFLEQVARSSGDFRLGLLQRFMVDVYALQHPDRYCESAKSFAAHLTGLCCAMEFNSAQSVHVAILRWLNGASPVGELAARGARPTHHRRNPRCRARRLRNRARTLGGVHVGRVRAAPRHRTPLDRDRAGAGRTALMGARETHS